MMGNLQKPVACWTALQFGPLLPDVANPEPWGTSPQREAALSMGSIRLQTWASDYAGG